MSAWKVLYLMMICLWGSMLMHSAQANEEMGSEEEKGVVFVPEYNIVDCTLLTKKSDCKRERKACEWTAAGGCHSKTKSPDEL